MRVRRLGIALGQVALPAVLAVGAMQVLAQSEGEPESRAIVSNSFLYQGRLEIDGVPVNGQCSMQFLIYDAAVGGSSLLPAQTTGVNVSEGVFSVVVGAGSLATSVFDGNGRWLDVKADCGNGLVALGRQELFATPYALALRPGAEMEGSLANGIINVTNTANSGEGIAATAANAFSSTLSDVGLRVVTPQVAGVIVSDSVDDGVRVSNPGDDGINVTGAAGDGIDATTTNASSYGGKFSNSITNGAAIFANGGPGNSTADIVLGSFNFSNNIGRISTQAQSGADLALRAYDQLYVELHATGETGNFIINNESDQVFEIRDNGNIRQANEAFGIPKLAMRVACGNSGSAVETYSSSLMFIAAPTISNGNLAGDCTINTNLTLAGHYVVGTPIATAPRTLAINISGTTIQVSRGNESGTGTNGDVFIIVY